MYFVIAFLYMVYIW